MVTNSVVVSFDARSDVLGCFFDSVFNGGELVVFPDKTPLLCTRKRSSYDGCYVYRFYNPADDLVFIAYDGEQIGDMFSNCVVLVYKKFRYICEDFENENI